MTVRPDIVKELGLAHLVPPPLRPRPEAIQKLTQEPIQKNIASAHSPAPLVQITPAAKSSTSSTTLPPDIHQLDWTHLKETALSCQRCPLHQTRTKVAFGVGDLQAHTLFIGEAPGAEEDSQGIPFVGQAGQLLDQMLFAIGLTRKSGVYITNITKCRPPQNRNPNPEEAQTCLPFLQQQIKLIKPRLLVALGKVAVTYLLNTEENVGNLRQKLHDYQGIPLVVTYHPAYLLRSPHEKRKSWEDLKFIRKLQKDDKS